jgi:hypothetical protein
MYTIILETGTVIRDSDGVIVSPCQSVDEPNYSDYINWVNAGNSPAVGEHVEPKVPLIVTPRQIRLALSMVGLRASVEAGVAAGTQEMKDTWEYSTEFQRSNPMIISMASALGQSSAQLDQLFALASTL